ncbi:hypothetical protein AOQ84DRAFT_371328 [Glonium stellatum]|uniref:Uncharacterized protein n=1 Tax=Glonium stellatum TaxID=574774 RepID=A0A8E2JZ04_9PEZI|nr:hypothetical protein AOQ84DRAFT_371328 [Glonium stellatum]
MSDTQGTSADALFTERESKILGWVMQSLKSGPPEVDYDKLAMLAGMSNPKSAANAWAKIKPKLFGDTAIAKPATPKKPRGKNPNAGNEVASAAGTNGEADEPSKKTPSPRKRKPAANKEDGGSPKKKGRKPKKDVEAETTPPNDDVATNASEATTLIKSDEAVEEAVEDEVV